MEKEIWKDVEGYEGLYKVSNCGRILSIGGHRRGPNGIRYASDKIRTPHVPKKRYAGVNLWKEGKSEFKLVHRLVANAFIQKVEGKNYVNHIDANKSNNFYKNLEWVTAKENIKHAYDNDLMNTAKGDYHCCSKINSQIAFKIKKMLLCGIKVSDITKEFGITRSIVNSIKKGETWKHVKI